MPKSEKLPVSDLMSALIEDADFVGEDTEFGGEMLVFTIAKEDDPEIYDFLMSKPDRGDYLQALLHEAIREKKTFEIQGE